AGGRWRVEAQVDTRLGNPAEPGDAVEGLDLVQGHANSRSNLLILCIGRMLWARAGWRHDRHHRTRHALPRSPRAKRALLAAEPLGRRYRASARASGLRGARH